MNHKLKKKKKKKQEEEQQEEEEEEWAKFITTNRFVDNTVIGYATEIWQIKLPKSIETINDFSSKNYHDIIQSATRAIGGGKVGYWTKYLNPNLLALITTRTLSIDPKTNQVQSSISSIKNNPDPSINIYLIDTITGHIIDKVIHKNSQGPVHIIQNEHKIIYHYYNIESDEYEISCIELYQDDNINNINKQDKFSSYTTMIPRLLQQTYVTIGPIRTMSITKSNKGISTKQILLALENGSIIAIDMKFLDVRRPTYLEKLKELDKIDMLIPYTREIPIQYNKVISYNRTIAHVNSINTYGAMLESTSIIFAHGIDLFYTLITPAGRFDLLGEDFNHYLLVLIVIAINSFYYITTIS